MARTRAFRLPIRIALAGVLLVTTAGPVAARDVGIVVQTSSPATVTAGLPVAYPVVASNTGPSTLNHVTVSGIAPAGFGYLGAAPAEICSQTQPLCTIGQVSGGAPFPTVTFYFLVPASPGSFSFVARATVNEGGNDNSDGSSNAQDVFDSNPVVTNVVAQSDDFVSGHSFPGYRIFTTGLDTLGAGNPHGSRVELGTNAEVIVADLAPGEAPACPGPAAETCFGWATDLSVAQGASVAGGIEVTMRWDADALPNGMTPKKLKVIHVFDPGVTLNGLSYAIITDTCTSSTQTHCFTVAPFKLPDKDIQATFRLPFNGISKGWN